MSQIGSSPQVGVKIFETWEVKLTPRKFNIAPENWWLEDEFPFGMKIFLGAMWKKFRGVGSAVNPFMATSSFSVPGTFSCPDPCHPMECQPCRAISHSASQQNTSPTEAADLLTHWVTHLGTYTVSRSSIKPGLPRPLLGSSLQVLWSPRLHQSPSRSLSEILKKTWTNWTFKKLLTWKNARKWRCQKEICNQMEPHVPWSKVAILGMVIQPLIGNPYNGYINPYYWETMGV